MKYAIQNTSGLWWTGTCWGVIQAREEYESLDDIPVEIDDTEGTLEYWCNSTQYPLDAGYSLSDDDGWINARVYEIGRKR